MFTFYMVGVYYCRQTTFKTKYMELVGAFILGSVGQLVIAVAVMQADQDHLFWLANGGLAEDW